MTGPTHKQYAICFAFIANALLYVYGVTEINYYLSLPIMLLLGKHGALFPDIDHTWKNVKEKTIPNKIINTLIHITGGKHRSWQTHSIDIVIIATSLSYILPTLLFQYEIISAVNKEVMFIIMLGFCSGWISHIFSDMLTSAGVKIVCFLPFKLALVPKKIGKLKFNTGNQWEAFCYKTTRIINIVLGIGSLAFPLIIDGTIIKFITNLLGGGN